MSRTFTYNALVLRTRPSGEANREAWLLTAEEGIVKATVFGGPKSSLRAHVAPFHRGQIWIYHDPVRDSRKITDFDVRSWRPGLRELYERTMAADGIAETILTTQGGGGSWEAALALTDRSLDALESADSAVCLRILLQFLWNWADFLGQKPVMETCASCGDKIGFYNEESGFSACPEGADGLLWFSPAEEGFICPACANRQAVYTGRSAGLLPLGKGARRWLAAIETLDPFLMSRYSLDGVSLKQAKAVVTGLLSGILGKRIAAWDEV
ncbi:MAG: recombination protein O N-terminal domain-containing protein [Treponema sp.]|jgi:DNA repair protein RecO (recombination protein O)|nr:recombination protein O N-terminal domain-containing protein [Treponema sp.]